MSWDVWVRRAPGVPPIGHLLREAMADCWVRVHNLPYPRRLPATGRERAALLRRNNTVASAVLGIGAPCKAYFALERTSLDATQLQDLPPMPRWHVDADDIELTDALVFRCIDLTWRPGVLDVEIAARAAGNHMPFTVISEGTNGIYCPYDGGADLFFPHAQDAIAATELFRPWLSRHPAGL